MKKFLNIFLSVAFMMFSVPTLYAQGGIAEKVVEFKDSISLSSAVSSYIFMVLATLILTQLAKKALNKTPTTPSWAVRYLSQVIGITFTWLLGSIGILTLTGSGIFHVFGFGFLAAITSNGLFDTKIIRWIFSKLKKKI